MTVINTNIGALGARYNLSVVNNEMETAMARLSSGLRINGAGDDAAGLAIASRMESQIRGLTQAVRNANDGISLLQTTEGAVNEVSNMLQRMRELAVQASSGSNNPSDQAALDLEVQQLKTEIDRIASTTQFNSQNVLDGTFNKVLQIGDKSGHTLDVKIDSVSTNALGMAGASFDSNTLIGQRIANDAYVLNSGATIAEGDIKINGQDVGEIADNSDMEDILKAINDNVDNVTATAFNVVTAKQIGTGVTTDTDNLVISVMELGQGTATTFTISASDSMAELLDNINNEAGGVVQASLNSAGKLVLSNDTGATIRVHDNSATDGGSVYDGGSGFEDADADFGGFIKLDSDDGNPIRIERGNLHMSSPGSDADLEDLGFRETTAETDDDAYTLTGIALTAAGSAASWGQTDIKINGVTIYDVDIDTDTFAGKLDAINNFSEDTGVIASAWYEESFDFSGISFTATDKAYINGTAVTVAASIDLLVSNINAAAGPDGITATRKGDNIIISGGFTTVTFRNTDSAGTAAAGDTYFGAAAAGQAGGVTEDMGRIRLDSIANQPISIELDDTAVVATGTATGVDAHGFLESNVGAADFEVNAATLGVSAGSTVAGLSVANGDSAADALKTLDNAINKVDAIRSQLGALNNRLDYTVTNLSNIVLNTEAAKSQILDADFSTETTRLTKAQILTQAATSMLAQANQSKQSILSLLQQ